MSTIVGIDLGTTHSLIAHLTPEGPRLIPNALGDFLTPSVVAVDQNGRWLIGKSARERQVTHPDSAASMFKRHMGTDWKCALAGREFTAVELSGLVLKALKEDAESELGQPVERAVITVPAYFNEHQRTDTIQAGTIAGLRVERIINEPTAAALAYGRSDSERDRTVLVFDLGGGTFDVSIVEQTGDILEVRASAGEVFLGGEDFTTTMAARILESQQMVFERIELKEPARLSRLRQECERAKRQLGNSDTVEIRFPDAKGEFLPDSPPIAVTRESFEKWTEGLVGRCELPLRRALGDSGLKRHAIDEVILVGGATRMPSVIAYVTRIFGKPPLQSINPDEVVALGAAIQAGLTADDRSVEDLVVTDVAPFTLGIEISREIAGQIHPGYYLPIINRNTTLPCSRVQQVSTLRPNQESIAVHVYQGEGRRADQNLLLGQFDVHGIPRGPAGQAVSIRFTYDLNGILEVEAEVIETRRKTQHVISKHARGLSSRQIAQAVRDMTDLKRVRREEAVNLHLLQRADRPVAEVPRTDRGEVDDLLTGFEAVLDLGDDEAIERFRAAIEEFLVRFQNPPEFGGSDDW